MTTNGNNINIESRVQLFSTLAEAAELEHSLLCCYIYSLFSLKSSVDEDISQDELNSINKWRKIILGIALEEMTHLTLVANLMSAIGGSPHFMRPNFPTTTGAFPADLVVQLAPFDLETIKHFVYLERPGDHEIKDSNDFNHLNYVRESPKGRLMPYGGDYKTVGELYRTIENSIESLVKELGEEKLFCGSPSLQIGPVDSPLPGLTVITNLDTAQKALDTIVNQGEGAKLSDNSHFSRFSEIQKEYEDILSRNPGFNPARPAARNPVMRRPPTPEGKVWCNEYLASVHMDLANAVYIAGTRLLVQVYENRHRDHDSKRALLNASFALMRAMTPLGESLTYLAANKDNPGINAGMSFAIVRSLAPIQDIAESTALLERLEQILTSYEHIVEETRNALQNKTDGVTEGSLEKLINAEQFLNNALNSVKKLKTPDINNEVLPVKKDIKPVSENTPVQKSKITGLPHGDGIDQAKGKNISISFDSNRCIHSRHCVTELPKVFLANTPGEWLYPDKADPEILAAVIRKCPSGAIQYIRHDEANNEIAPETNLAHIRENGPYAFLADLKVNGESDNFRATLCRCGQSSKKPYCDGSHVKAKFQATGEPLTLDTTALESRNGILDIQPQKNGPLHVKGNVEICAGTGRSVLKTTETKLCRCGNSQAKPLCDGSHVIKGFVAEGYE